MLIDEIKTRMTQAMRERDEVVRNVLGLAARVSSAPASASVSSFDLMSFRTTATDSSSENASPPEAALRDKIPRGM